MRHTTVDFQTERRNSVEIQTPFRSRPTPPSLEHSQADHHTGPDVELDEIKRHQMRLIRSEKLNSIGNLATGLLHEINIPLNYGLTALQLIRSDAAIRDNEFVQGVIDDIDEGVQRVRTIVSDLLAYTCPSSEAEKRSTFRVEEALESAVRFTSHELKGIAVVSDLPNEIVVMGSKNHITHVLVSLLTNSVKAIRKVSAEHRGQIKVTGAIRDSRFLITVADNGAGMDKKTLERIVDPCSTTRDVGAGVDLGLSICHTIIANHGGILLADSKPGEGSELKFDLPLAEDAQIYALKTPVGLQ